MTPQPTPSKDFTVDSCTGASRYPGHLKPTRKLNHATPHDFWVQTQARLKTSVTGRLPTRHPMGMSLAATQVLKRWADSTQILDRAGLFYIVPKIHKQGNPGRPIISGNGHPLNAFLHLLIITWNLWYNHIRPTSKTRPTFFTNSSNLVQSTAIYSLRLMFHHHIQTYHITHYNQCSVFKRFKSLITRNVMLRLYKAFMLPRFHCWSLIWHFCCERIVIN